MGQKRHFRRPAELPLGKPCGVTTWPRQAGYVTGADRIGNQNEHDGHSASHLLQRPHYGAASGQDNLGRECHEFCSVLGITCCIATAPAVVDLQVSANVPSQLPEALMECPDAGLCLRVARLQRGQDANASHFDCPMSALPPKADMERTSG